MPRPALKDPYEFLIGRVRVDPTDWMVEFHLKLVGAYDWVPWAAEIKRRMLRAFRLPRDPSGGPSSGRSDHDSDAHPRIGSSLNAAQSS